MPCVNCIDMICSNRCVRPEPTTKAVCNKCHTAIDYNDVSEGYHAACPSCDEDLYTFEIIILSKNDCIGCKDATSFLCKNCVVNS